MAAMFTDSLVGVPSLPLPGPSQASRSGKAEGAWVGIPEGVAFAFLLHLRRICRRPGAEPEPELPLGDGPKGHRANRTVRRLAPAGCVAPAT